MNYQLYTFLSYAPFILLFIAFVINYDAYKSGRKKKLVLNKDRFKIRETRFDWKISNRLYAYSFMKYFRPFIPEENDKKANEITALIVEANMNEKFDYRVYTMFQLLMAVMVLLLTLLLLFMVTFAKPLLTFLFNIREFEQNPINSIVIIGAFLLLLTLFLPSAVLKYIRNHNRSEFIKNLPVLQLIVITQINSNRTISEILYLLGKMDIYHQDVFAIAYRMYLRNRTDAFEFLETAFKGTGFVDTIIILSSLDNYSRNESARVLKGKMDGLRMEVAALKKRKGLLRGLLSEGSVGLPFCAVMIFGALPIVNMAMRMMQEINGMF